MLPDGTRSPAPTWFEDSFPFFFYVFITLVCIIIRLVTNCRPKHDCFLPVNTPVIYLFMNREPHKMNILQYPIIILYFLLALFVISENNLRYYPDASTLSYIREAVNLQPANTSPSPPKETKSPWFLQIDLVRIKATETLFTLT